MRIEHEKKGSELYVRLCGELDDSSGTYARITLDSLISDISIKAVHINMSQLTFMDSTGIGVLIGRYKKLKERGVPIYLSSPTPAVDKVLYISGIYNIMYKAG